MFDIQEFHKQAFDIAGTVFDIQEFDIQGCDIQVFDKQGYDIQVFDKQGFDKQEPILLLTSVSQRLFSSLSGLLAHGTPHVRTSDSKTA